MVAITGLFASLSCGGPIHTEYAIFKHTVPQRTDPFRRVSLRTKATAGVVFVYPETRRAALKMPTSAFIGTNPELVEN